jgi:Na+/H+ antiporter NhaD/arsenite permease-like protein
MQGVSAAVRATAAWVRQNAVFVIALALAGASVLFVPPDAAYLAYFDAHTLTMLFCMLATITALQRARFFTAVGTRVVRALRTLRGLGLGLVLMTAATSAFFTNDMALIAMLPIAFVALDSTGNLRHLAFVFVMMAIGANLGGMITPFGSPHNLFLHSFYSIPSGEFVGIMLIPFLVSLALMTGLCLLLPNTRIEAPRVDLAFSPRLVLVYLALFALTLLLVLRVVPVWAGAAVPLVLLFADRGALARLDWGLLGTFAAFFVFAGNLTRIPELSELVRGLLGGGVLLVSALISQVISNVPAAILLSHFTDDYPQLLLGVNVGGVGTLVASLASLIALAHYRRLRPGRTWAFVGLFSAVNFGFLAVLLGLTLWLSSLGLPG